MIKLLPTMDELSKLVEQSVSELMTEESKNTWGDLTFKWSETQYDDSIEFVYIKPFEGTVNINDCCVIDINITTLRREVVSSLTFRDAFGNKFTVKHNHPVCLTDSDINELYANVCETIKTVLDASLLTLLSCQKLDKINVTKLPFHYTDWKDGLYRPPIIAANHYLNGLALVVSTHLFVTRMISTSVSNKHEYFIYSHNDSVKITISHTEPDINPVCDIECRIRYDGKDTFLREKGVIINTEVSNSRAIEFLNTLNKTLNDIV